MNHLQELHNVDGIKPTDALKIKSVSNCIVDVSIKQPLT